MGTANKSLGVVNKREYTITLTLYSSSQSWRQKFGAGMGAAFNNRISIITKWLATCGDGGMCRRKVSPDESTGTILPKVEWYLICALALPFFPVSRCYCNECPPLFIEERSGGFYFYSILYLVPGMYMYIHTFRQNTSLNNFAIWYLLLSSAGSCLWALITTYTARLNSSSEPPVRLRSATFRLLDEVKRGVRSRLGVESARFLQTRANGKKIVREGSLNFLSLAECIAHSVLAPF